MIEAFRSYLQLASGLAEVSAAKAKEAAATLAAQGPENAPNPEALTNGLATIAEDLVEQGRTNTDILVGLVKTEVDRAVGRMGFVREEELAAVRRHVQRLEAELMNRSELAAGVAESAMNAATASARTAASTARSAAEAAATAALSAPKLASMSPETPTSASGAVRTTAPKKANPSKSTVQASSSSSAVGTGESATGSASGGQTPAAKKAVSKKAPAKKPAAKKAPAKKSVAKKASASAPSTTDGTPATS